MRVILATGVPELDRAIQERILKAQFVGTALYKESVVEVVERKKPDVIILSELLDGVLPTRELILILRTRFPEVRIIYILKEEEPKEKAFLYHWTIFDVLTGKFTPADLENAVFNPKQWKDVSHELDDIKEFDKPSDLVGDSDISNLNNINASNYSNLDSDFNRGIDLYQQIVSFWSVLDQSGKTFSAVNTSLLLASNKDIKILLVDFNIKNPNIHLHFGIVDADKNLGAIIDDVENGVEINKDNFDEYLVTHPVYKNLKILPGYILKMVDKDENFVSDIFDKILDVAQKSNYSTILVDLESGLKSKTNINILKKSSKILLHVPETAGGLYSVRRCFDNEVGPFVTHLIDKKKVTPVINMSHENMRSEFFRALEMTTELRTGAIIFHDDNVRDSLFDGTPLLSKKPPEEMYDSFVTISNLIHNNIFKKPIKRNTITPKQNKKDAGGNKFSLFGAKNKDKKK